MTNVIISGGRVVDPASGMDAIGDVAVLDGRIAAVGTGLGSAERVGRFLRASRLVFAATSFGGLHTSADRRAQFGDDTAPGFVRLSCGIEDTVDLVADLTTALDTSA